MHRRPLLAIVVAFATMITSASAADPQPERLALDYLSREVPRWSRENHCYSCHNNGDAARALYDAVRRGDHLAPAALADTSNWLTRLDGWDQNGGDGPFNDRVLARVQFTSSLLAASEAGAPKAREALDRATAQLARDQTGDGSWPIDDAGSVGSPATYGRPLATLTALQTLRRVNPEHYRNAIRRAETWLARQPIVATLDAAVAVMSSLPRSVDDRPLRGFERLKESQSTDGGWGPFADDPPETFDTAVALLALASLDATPEISGMIAKGRAFLIASQSAEGSWTETTRPSGGDSYAQRISTTGWATLALLATRKPGAERKR